MERTVAAVCDVCGKGPVFGNNVSFSHRRTRRRWNPNIQRRRTTVGGTSKRVNVCTSCIKAGKITRRSEEHTSELQSQSNLVCRLLLEKKKHKQHTHLSQ